MFCSHSSASAMRTPRLDSFLAVALLAAAMPSALAQVLFDDCGSTASDVELFVTDCQGTACTVKKGSTIEVIIDFTPTQTANLIESRAYGYISGAPIPYDQVPLDGCPGIIGGEDGGESGCPLTKGSRVQYRIQLDIRHDYPTQTLSAMWELTDEDDVDVVCLTVPVSIVS